MTPGVADSLHAAPSGERSSNARQRPLWMSILRDGSIVLMVLLVYLPAIRGGFVWDDDSWTTKIADLLRDSSGLRSIWLRPTALQQYYPLSGTTFWLDHQLWGFRPLPYHLENVLLHALAALLFGRSLRRLAIPGAWLASAMFALHPVMVESAAWIAERKNVLSLPLCLGALLAYLDFERRRRGTVGGGLPEPPAASSAARPRTGYASLSYVLACLLFLAALLAKTTACFFPAAILLLAWWRRGALRWRQDVLPTLPFFVLGIGMCALTAWLEKAHVGAHGADYALTVSERCLIAGRAFWFYLGKLVFPANLCFVYPRWQADAGVWWQWLYPVAALGFLFTLWRARAHIGRGPVTALFFFAGALFPLLGFVNVYYMRYSFVCDHWLYLPSLGPIALIACGISAAVRARTGELFLKAAVGAFILVTLGLLTSRQAAMYGDVESLWRTTIRRNPGAWFAHNNLGTLLFRKGYSDEAIGEFQEAIRLKPDLAEAYTNLGVAFGSKGKLGQAISAFSEAIRRHPDYAEAHYDLGIALALRGEKDAALTQHREAIRLKH
ncbi:MAG: tetratricopeptide repeat protein [Polyangiaceae bacterium]